MYSKLPQGAFFGINTGRTLECALNAEMEQRGTAVGVWHVLRGQAHYMFHEESEARRYVAKLLRQCRRTNQKERAQMADRLAMGQPLEGDRHPGPMRIEHSGGVRREFDKTFNVGERWRFYSWHGMRDENIHLFQRTEEMEQNRQQHERREWERAAAQAQRQFARIGNIYGWSEWPEALNTYSRAYGQKHGLLPTGVQNGA